MYKVSFEDDKTNDNVYIMLDYKEPKNVLIGINIKSIDNCETTQEVLMLLTKYYELKKDIVKSFKQQYME